MNSFIFLIVKHSTKIKITVAVRLISVDVLTLQNNDMIWLLGLGGKKNFRAVRICMQKIEAAASNCVYYN